MPYYSYVYGEIHGPDLLGELCASGFEVVEYKGTAHKKAGTHGLYHNGDFTGFDVGQADLDVLTGISDATGEEYSCGALSHW